MVWIAYFNSPHYPEDNKILGVYSDKTKADSAVQSAIESDMRMHPNYPRRYQQKSLYYTIEEFDLE